MRGEPPLIAEGLFSFEIGGSERVGADVALECARRGYRVLCFAFYGSNGPMRRALEAEGIECVDLNYLRRTRFIRRLTYQVSLYRFLRARRVHAIHIHHATSLLLGGLAARAAGVPRIILTEHSIKAFDLMPHYRRQTRRYLPLAHAVTVVHPSMQDYFRTRLGVSASRLHCVPNGIRLPRQDAALRRKLREELGAEEGDIVWMYAGRLVALKGLETLIEAFARAQGAAAARLKLVIAGEGEKRVPLEALARSLGLEATVRFLGPRADVPQLMTAIDGFAMSSLEEGLPMVLLEAMAARVPCVATAVGGIPELMSEGAGMLVEPGDSRALAERLLELSADGALRRRVGEAGFAKVAARNDLERVIDEYLRIFELPPRWSAACSPRSNRVESARE